MRIKSDVEFVKRECEGIWMSEMADYCGQEVISYNVDRDGDYVCHFSNGGNWAYPPSCIEGLSTLEKGKKYTVNGSTMLVVEFVEESENFVIFEGGIVFKKKGNTFTEYDPKPEFVKKDWNVEVNSTYVIVRCDDFSVAMFTRDGCDMIGGLPKSLGFTLDENDAVNVIK